jgi:hypothetical protein
MTPNKMLDTIYDDLIGKFSSVKDFKDILPHTVFVEEDQEDGDPDNERRYHRYFLQAVLPHGQALLSDPHTNIRQQVDLRAINIEWLITIWEAYQSFLITKELRIFLYPVDNFDRGTPDEEILAAWREDIGQTSEIYSYAPQEYAAEFNDENSGVASHWMRCIYI